VIWTDFGNFKALATQVAADAKAASVAAMQGQDAFSLAWQKVSEGCHGCHDKYAPLFF
jgi:cytochrome c556